MACLASERELDRELHLARRADGCIHGSKRSATELPIGIAEAGCIGDVIRLDPELQVRAAMHHREILEQRHVEPALRRPVQQIPRYYLVTDRVGWLHRERRSIEPPRRTRVVDARFADEVWTIGAARVGSGSLIRNIK